MIQYAYGTARPPPKGTKGCRYEKIKKNQEAITYEFSRS